MQGKAQAPKSRLFLKSLILYLLRQKHPETGSQENLTSLHLFWALILLIPSFCPTASNSEWPGALRQEWQSNSRLFSVYWVVFVIFFFLRQDHLGSRGWPQAHKLCPLPPGAAITGLCHHAQPQLYLNNTFSFFLLNSQCLFKTGAGFLLIDWLLQWADLLGKAGFALPIIHSFFLAWMESTQDPGGRRALTFSHHHSPPPLRTDSKQQGLP